MNAVVAHQPQDNLPTTTNNPFHGTAIATRGTNNAVADAGQQREIAEVQAAMVIAKRFPRDPIAAMDSILQAFTRPSLAEGALYSYSRGGSDVTGPSIRTAEVLAQAWGNVQFGVRELEQRNGESTVEAFAWDVQSNTRQVKVFQVKHERHTRQGVKRLEDPRDVYELVANQGARRLRACILGVIPGDVTEAAVRQAEETLSAHADTSADGIKKLLAAFEAFGVTKEQIEKRIQCRIEAIRPAQVVNMKKVYASLRDGMSAPADWFEVDPGAAPAAPATLRDKVRAKAASKPEPDPEPATESLPTKEIRRRLQLAETVDEVRACDALIAAVPDDAERDDLRVLQDSRLIALQ